MTFRPTTIVVGTGVVNLVSAYFLSKLNHKLILIDKAPSPFEENSWESKGCTFGGENVRMYSYTEADNYNEKGSKLYAEMNKAFEQTIANDGWLVREKVALSQQEHDWIRDFHQVTPEQALQFSEDIYSVNIRSGKYWEKWMNEAPDLFQQVDLRKGILRIYSDTDDFVAARKLHKRLGSLDCAFEAKESAEEYPNLYYAYEKGLLGGCMRVKGFTLKVQDFCKNIIYYLENYGAEFRWNTPFSEIKRNDNGKVAGIVIEDGLEKYDNYLLSLGAYAGTTVKNTQTNNQIHGVLGVWLTIPNLYPELNHSIKIHKAGHVGEDSNVTLINKKGSPVLVLGSGYGYVGSACYNQIKSEEITGIYESMEETAKTYFPEAYDMAIKTNTINEEKKYCVRAWTPTSLGIFESIPTVSAGRLLITGGNNTGGFTQAPDIAEAVVAAFKGNSHPMHDLFHPQRINRKIFTKAHISSSTLKRSSTSLNI